jgi:hypothetical protein
VCPPFPGIGQKSESPYFGEFGFSVFGVSTSLLRVHLRGAAEMRQVTAFLRSTTIDPRTHLRRQKSAARGGGATIAILPYTLDQTTGHRQCGVLK